jgi:LmbE family N-acetylglucosaminyl deacetylase
MLALNFSSKPHAPLRLLCLGAHADDIEIGCGGFILQLLQSRRPVEITWVVFSGRAQRASEARRSAKLFLKGASKSRIRVMSFRDGFFPYAGARLKEAVEQLKAGPRPDLVFTHYRDDRHQDHRLVSELAWNTFRDQWILEYEIPKFDGDFGIPNCFVPLDEQTSHRKARYLIETFRTQRKKDWFTGETFLSVMRLRGMECRAPSAYAEAFYSRKTIVQL